TQLPFARAWNHAGTGPVSAVFGARYGDSSRTGALAQQGIPIFLCSSGQPTRNWQTDVSTDAVANAHKFSAQNRRVANTTLPRRTRPFQSRRHIRFRYKKFLILPPTFSWPKIITVALQKIQWSNEPFWLGRGTSMSISKKRSEASRKNGGKT